MERAWIDGSPVALDAAIAEAARLLGASRLPVIAGLDCDVAGAREAIALARRLGGVCDHADSDVMLHTLDAMREAGAIVTTPNEARLRADTLLMIGSSLGVDWTEIAEELTSPLAPEAGAKKRRMVWLCPDDRQRTGDTARRYGRVVGRSNGELPALLAVLRARVAGRPIQQQVPPTPPRRAQGRVGGGEKRLGDSGLRLTEIDVLAADLKAAKFGVALWATQDLDALATEMVFGLIDDLNAHTRFGGASLAPGQTGRGVMETCGWLTGFPCPVGFGRGVPEHDPWRFETKRLVESGEADCVLWISTGGHSAPQWQRSVPVVAIGHHPSVDPARQAARVYIEVGYPGIHHQALLYSMWTGTIAAVAAVDPRDVPSVADVLARIAAALPVPSPLVGRAIAYGSNR